MDTGSGPSAPTTNVRKQSFRVGSRKSELAMRQAKHVIGLLKTIYPDFVFEIIGMTTTGDDITTVPLYKTGEKSLFTKELEAALQDKTVDFVVHSLKDLPTTLPSGMTIAAILERENPHDAVVLRRDLQAGSLADLPANSVIGTSSLRRAAQLKRHYPHLRFEDVRGNLNTRLRKLDDSNKKYDALILAVAGLIRMGWQDRISIILPTDVCMYAVGQGALAVECRESDSATLELIQPLVHVNTMLCCILERAFLKYLEGGCSVPCAISAVLTGNKIVVHAGVYSIDGSQAVEGNLCVQISHDSPNPSDPEAENNQVGVHPQHVSKSALCTSVQAGFEMGKILKELGGVEILTQARMEIRPTDI